VAGRRKAGGKSGPPHGGAPETKDRPKGKLPRGVNRLPQELVYVSQHSRIVEGTAHAVAAKGYAETTVADIIAQAGVSRTTFYQLFKDKESCFLACFEALAEAHHAEVEQALARPVAHPERLFAAIQAYMHRVDADRSFARAFIGEAESATPAIREAFDRVRQRLEASLRGWFERARQDHPELPQPGPTAFELVNIAVGGLVVKRARSGQALAIAVPEVVGFVLAGLGMSDWANQKAH
jgi:AcrR family transcriptional regulator